MAKRKLAGAALAAYNRKRRRTALVRRGSSSVTVRVVPSRKRARRRRGVVGGGPSLRAQVPQLVAASVYGFITRGDSPTAAQARAYLAKVPVIEAIGAPASHGLLAHFIARRVSGRARRYLDLLAHAALMRAADNLGASAFDVGRASQMMGGDPGVALAGEMDDYDDAIDGGGDDGGDDGDDDDDDGDDA